MKGWQRLWPYLLLFPFFVVFALFIFGPVLIGGYQSLFRDRVVGGRIFVGLANYLKVMGDESFWEGVRRIALFGIIFIPITVGLALLFALALDAGVVRWPSIFRLTFFLPFAVPGVVATLMWGFLYGPSLGPLTAMAEAAGIGHLEFLTESTMLFSIGNITVWLYVGYNMIVLYAALKAIPGELYEAAVLDGANSWRISWHIKIPLIMPVISVIMIFSIIGTLQLFTEPAVLRPLAPSVIGNDYVPNFYAFSLASTGQQFNYVAALSFVLATVVLMVSVAYLLVSRRARTL